MKKKFLACAIHKFFALHFRRRRSHAPLLTPPLQILVLLLDLMLFLSSTTPIFPTFGPAHISSSKQTKTIAITKSLILESNGFLYRSVAYIWTSLKGFCGQAPSDTNTIKESYRQTVLVTLLFRK